MQLMRRITTLAPSFLLTSILAIVPALAKISEAFPQQSDSTIQLLVTLPSLVAFPVILLSGALAGIMTKKMITLTSLALMLAGGLLPVFFYQSFGFLLAAGVIFGLGLGGLSPMTASLVHEHYPEDKDAMTGYLSAFMGAGGMLLSFVGGQLATIHWRFAYLSYLLIIPVIILVLFLPKGIIVKDRTPMRGIFNPSMIYYLVQCVITSIGFNVFNTNISMYIEGAGLGTSDTSGVVTSIFSAISIVSGILTGRIMAKLKKFTLSTLFIVGAAGMLTIYIGGSLATAIIGAFLIGFVFSIFMPAGYSKATQSAPPAAATMAIAIYCCSHQLGQFLTPYAINNGAKLLGGDTASKFLLAFLILGVMFVVSMIRETRFAPKATLSGGPG